LVEGGEEKNVRACWAPAGKRRYEGVTRTQKREGEKKSPKRNGGSLCGKMKDNVHLHEKDGGSRFRGAGKRGVQRGEKCQFPLGYWVAVTGADLIGGDKKIEKGKFSREEFSLISAC